ncbi:MAG: hypothetical protein P8P20_14970, partial [Acidimicrobiales bacterium]|nr:hypothetical protein [Acidimicrobiales bacterium]
MADTAAVYPADAELDPETSPLLHRPSVAAATWALFLGLGLVMIGNGLNGSLLGVRSEAAGFDLTITGVIMAAYFVGFLVGTTYAER